MPTIASACAWFRGAERRHLTGRACATRYLAGMRRSITLMALLLLPGAALGWSFSPLPVCTLHHQGDSVAVTLTHDPDRGDYAITLTLADGGWPPSRAFHITFEGGRAMTIGTGFHTLSDDGRSLTVRDTGFGNVLDGLEYNSRALAWAGERRAPFTLLGVAEPVRAFRACPQGLTLS